MNGDGLFIVLACVLLFAIGVGVEGCAGSLANEDKAVSLLEVQGFSDVRLLERNNFFAPFHGCSKDDTTHYVFAATNVAGRQVHVQVCQGWPLRGPHIRGS